MASKDKHQSDLANKSSANLNWRAFQYAHDELSSGEAAAFELLLLTDQVAREAVIAAAKLTQAVRAASGDSVTELATPVTSGARTKGKSRVARWLAAGVAACAAAIAGVAVMNSNALRDRPAENHRNPATAQVRALALRWSELNSFANDDGFGIPGDYGQGTLAADSTSQESIDRSPFEASDEDATPSWMLSAVTRKAM